MGKLHDQAVKGVADFRRAIAEDPTLFQEQTKKLQGCLQDCADRNATEGNVLRRIGLDNKNFQGRGFPRDLSLNVRDYLTTEYLLYASREIRKSLVSEWSSGLKKKAENIYKEDPALERAYGGIERLSWEYGDLKTKSLLQRIDRRTLYAVRHMHKTAKSQAEREDWEYPIDLSNKIDEEFEKANKHLLESYGIPSDALGHYYRIATSSYQEMRALKYAVVIGGSAVAIYGAGRLMAACASTTLASTGIQTIQAMDLSEMSMPISGTIPNYGFFSKPEFLSIPFNQIRANQLGFQHLSQGLSSIGAVRLAPIGATSTINPIEVARNTTGAINANYFSGLMRDPSSTPSAMKELATMLGLGISAANQATGTMLGSSSSFNVSSFSDGFATLTGTINGQSIHKTIRRIGSRITIS